MFLRKVDKDMKRYIHASSYPYKATLTIYRLDKIDDTDAILKQATNNNPLVVYEFSDSSGQFVVSGQSLEVLNDFKDIITSELAYKFINHIWS